MMNERNERFTSQVYFSGEKQKEYLNEKAKEEFGSFSRGVLTILTERYGTYITNGLRRVIMEGRENKNEGQN